AVACLITFMPAMASQSFAAKKLTVKPAKKTIYVKKSVTLKANQKVKWSASKSSLKVVKLTSKKAKSVKVTGKKAGKAVVTAKVGKQTKKVTITVKKAAVKKTAVTAVALSADNAKDPAKEVLVGTKLRAAVTPENATVTYQWKADGTAIAGATGSAFTVTTAEIGKAITVEATGTGNFEKTAVSAATAKVAAPKISTIELKKFDATSTADDKYVGTVGQNENVGTQLKAVATSTVNADVATYQWYRTTPYTNRNTTTVAISGATAPEYTLSKADIGSSVFAVVTPNAGVDASAVTTLKTFGTYKGSWVSAEVSVGKNISVSIQANGKAVKDNGSVVSGTKLTAVVAPADANVTYKWYRGNVAITGATSAEYTTVKADEGKAVKVEVSISDKETVYAGKDDATVNVTDVAKVFNKAVLSDTTADGRATDAADKAQVYATDDFAFAVYSLDAKGIDTKATENTDYKAVDYVNGQPVVLNGANYTAADVKDGVAKAKEGAKSVGLKVGDKLSKKAFGVGSFAGSEITSNEITITSLGRADQLFTKDNTTVTAATSGDKTTKLTITLPTNGFDADNTAFSAVVQAKKIDTTGLQDTTWETVGTYTKVDKAGEKTIAVDLNTTALEKYQKDYTFRVVLTTPNYFGSATVGVSK
ncbi:hypothetical protein, partial [Eubacterium pyruvativorans]|uniref:hypothetical protein n=1 Tax=Eubacterium pyruvativorans TaxID=155865 RepID=UPI0008859109